MAPAGELRSTTKLQPDQLWPPDTLHRLSGSPHRHPLHWLDTMRPEEWNAVNQMGRKNCRPAIFTACMIQRLARRRRCYFAPSPSAPGETDRSLPADALRPLPVIPYDYRDTAEALVHKDLRLQFDGNRYCVPHRFVGRRLTVKADSSSVTIYHRFQEIVSYARSWRRGQTFGAERFEPELAEFRPAARRSQRPRPVVRFSRRTLFESIAGSLSPRYRRQRSLSRAPDHRTAGTHSPVRSRRRGRRH